MSADAVKFEIGSVVFHRADGKRGIVTGILFTQTGTLYKVSFGHNTDTWAYSIELSEVNECVASS